MYYITIAFIKFGIITFLTQRAHFHRGFPFFPNIKPPSIHGLVCFVYLSTIRFLSAPFASVPLIFISLFVSLSFDFFTTMPQPSSADQFARTALSAAHFPEAPASAQTRDVYNRTGNMKEVSRVKWNYSPPLVSSHGRNFLRASNRILKPTCTRCLCNRFREYQQSRVPFNIVPVQPSPRWRTQGTSETTEVPPDTSWNPRSVRREHQHILSKWSEIESLRMSRERHPDVHRGGKPKTSVFISNAQLPTRHSISGYDRGCTKRTNSEIPKNSARDLQGESAKTEKKEEILEEESAKAGPHMEEEVAQSISTAGLSVRKEALDMSDFRAVFPSTGTHIDMR